MPLREIPDHSGHPMTLRRQDPGGCAWFKVTRDWIYDEVEAGRLPYLRLGRKHLRLDRGELTHYLKSAAGRLGSRQPDQPRRDQRPE
jgi:excisionase family DNA binding protein